MASVKIPNLPRADVTAAICGHYEPAERALKQRGVEIITVPPSPLLPCPVAHHADMLCCHAGWDTVVTCDRAVGEKLGRYGITAVMSDAMPGDKYPSDCILNCLVLEHIAVGRRASLDSRLLAALEGRGIKLIDVRQGYSRCSVAVVDEYSLITADTGISAALIAEGYDVLLIRPGGIILEGYDTGFIGGCCGKTAADRMLFCGNPATHPDGERILEFLSSKGVRAEASHDGMLTDFGGFIPLCE